MIIDVDPNRPMRLNRLRFKKYQKQSGLPATEIAARAGIDYSSLKRLLNGSRNVTPIMQARLLTVFPYDDLFKPAPGVHVHRGRTPKKQAVS